MLWTKTSGEFEWSISNSSARPAAGYGTSITPAASKSTNINTGGGFYQLFTGASVVTDVWGVLICLNNGATSAAARLIAVDIGINTAGSHTNGGYTVVIPNLLASNAAPLTIGGGVWYYFPLGIPAGSSIAARAISNATTALNCWVTLVGRPKYPHLTRVGSFVKAYGITEGANVGTTITSGTTSEGAATLLGTTTSDHWWWQVGMGINDTTITAQVYFLDLLVGPNTTNLRGVIDNQPIVCTAAEQVSNLPVTVGCAAEVEVGRNVYARLQCSGTADSVLGVAAYALGG